MPDHFPVSRRRFLLGSLSLGALSLLSGCGKQSTPSPTGSSGTASGSTAPGVLRYAMTENPTTFDPHLVFSARTFEMLANTFEPLVSYGPDNKLLPVLATELPTLSPDGKTYTVKLRPNVTFHDGSPLTAAVVQQNALRILSKDLASQRATLTLDDVAGAKEYMAGKRPDLPGVQVVDDHTLRFVLDEPRAYFPDKLTTFMMVSPKAMASAPKNEQGVREIDHTCAVGTGLFQISEYRPQSRIVQTANTNYWGDKPKLTRIERPVIIDAKTARNLYETGQLDIFLETVADYDADKQSSARKSELKEFDQAGVFFITLDMVKFPAFRDKRVRQALSLSVDRTTLSRDALSGMYPPANGYLAPGMLGSYDATELPESVTFNAEKAKALLAEAGYTAAKPLAFTLLYSEGSVTAARVTQVLKEQWGAIGLNVTLQESEWGTLLKRMQNHDFDAMYSGWSSTPEPHDTLYPLLATDSPNNYSGYASPEFNKLRIAIDRETNEAKRVELCHQAVKVALDDAAVIPIVFSRDVRLIRPYVTDLRFNLTGMEPHQTTAIR